MPTPTAPPVPDRVKLEPAELEAIYQEHSRPIYYLALRMLGDPTQAEDAAHDVFLKAYRKLGDFRGHSSIRTWLYRITYNLSLDTLRSKARRDTVQLDEETREANEDGPRPEHPSDTLSRRELAEVVTHAMSRLTEKHRAIIVLREIDGLSYEEIAFSLGLAVGTVKSRLTRARQALRLELREARA